MVPTYRAAPAALDRAFRSRPLVFFLAAWVVGILAADQWAWPPARAGGAGLGLVALCLFARRPWAALSLLLMGVALLGVAATRLAWQPPGGDVSGWAGQRVTVHGTVAAEARRRCDIWRIVLSVQSVKQAGQDVPARGRLLVSTPLDLSEYRPGDWLRVSGALNRPSAARNPGGFSRELWLARQRIFATMSARGLGEARLSSDWWPLQRGAARLRHHIAEANRQAMRDPRAAALVNSLLFGDLDQDEAQQWSEMETRFRRAGLSHVVVVSGAQVALLFGLLFSWRHWALRPHRRLSVWQGRLVRRLGGYSQRFALLVGLVFLAPYLLLAGTEISILRAALMAAVFFVGRCIDRESEPENSLAAAALLLLLHNPLSLYDIGGQLSFAAVWGILRLAGPLARLLGFEERDGTEDGPGGDLPWGFAMTPVAVIVCVTLAAQLATTPLVAQHFQRVSLIGLPANALVCLLAMILLPLGLLTSLLGAVLDALWGPASLVAGIIARPTEMLACSINGLVDLLARPDWASIAVFSPGWPVIAAYAFLLLVASSALWNHPRWARLVPLGLALALPGFGMLVPTGWVRVPTLTFVDVGQGDACLVRLPDGATMLVDGGGSPRAPCREGDCENTEPGQLAAAMRTDCLDVGRDILASFLRHERVRRIDLLVLSHPHDDHLWGLNALLAPSEGFQVDAVLDSGFPADGPAYREWQALLERPGLKRFTSRRGMQLRLGSAILDVLHPPAPHLRGTGSDANNNSIVLRLDVNGTRVLLPGDVEAAGEMALRGQDVSAHVLKVGHHGSRTSTSSAWLDRVRPEIAVISCGLHNRFGHPSETTLAALRQREIQYFRTDRNGAVTLELLRGEWIARPMMTPAGNAALPVKRGPVWNSWAAGKQASGGPR